jgi:hypothetical protein
MPNSATKPIAPRSRRRFRQSQRQHAADDRHRDHAEREQRIAHIAEIGEKQPEDDQQADRHHHFQPLHGIVEIGQFARPFQAVAGAGAFWAMRAWASATALPRSRLRTENLIGI